MPEQYNGKCNWKLAVWRLVPPQAHPSICHHLTWNCDDITSITSRKSSWLWSLGVVGAVAFFILKKSGWPGHSQQPQPLCTTLTWPAILSNIQLVCVTAVDHSEWLQLARQFECHLEWQEHPLFWLWKKSGSLAPLSKAQWLHSDGSSLLPL